METQTREGTASRQAGSIGGRWCVCGIHAAADSPVPAPTLSLPAGFKIYRPRIHPGSTRARAAAPYALVAAARQAASQRSERGSPCSNS
jgi:hypothetical protein